MNNMIYLFILFSSLIGMFSVGCSNEPTFYTLKLPTFIDDDEIIEDGILIRITTNKSTYQLGENVPILVYVENQSAQTITYTYSSAHIYLYVSGSISEAWATIGQDGQKSNVSVAIARPGELRAGESIVLETFWDQKLFEKDGKEITATLGSYNLTASFVGRPSIVVGTTIHLE